MARLPILALAFNHQGNQLASGGRDNTVKIWDTITRRQLYASNKHGGWVEGLAYSPDGKRLAVAVDDGSVVIWDMIHKREALTIDAHAQTCLAAAFSPDGTHLATASLDGLVKIFNGTPWTTSPARPAATESNKILSAQ